MDRKNVEDLYLLSPLQQGMLFRTLYSPGTGAYVEQVALVLGGRPRAAELRRAWQMVVDRHPVLRTGFVWEGVPKPLQVVFRKAELPWRQHDWSTLPEAEREARWERLLEEDRAQGFDLRRPPLLRFAFVRTAADEHRLLWTSHHILTDGWSVPIILGEVAALYHGLLNGTLPRLRPVRPFREYIAWLNRQDAAGAERYWSARLAGIEEPTPLPLDRAPALAGESPADHGRETHILPAEAVAALEEAARRMRVTVNSVLQGAWSIVLARAAATGEVVFGTTVSGRPPELPGVDEMVGMFINTLPVRVRVDDAAGVGDWLRAVHHDHVAAGEFEHAPLAEVQKWAGVHEKGGLFESLLVYENFPLGLGGEGEDDDAPAPDGALELTGLSSAERTDLPLSVAAAPVPDGMRLTATYDPRRLTAEDVRRVLGGLAEVIGQITAGEIERVADLSPFTAEDRRKPLTCWAGKVAEPVRETVPALFQAAAARTPDAVAVRAGESTLTYAELNAAANRLARHLRAHGVGVDDRVGVSLERSADLVVALLAILKAGAAYVPLDPAYPTERLAYMLRDSGTELVLVDGDAPAWAAGARVVSLTAETEAIGARSDDDLDVAGYDADALAYVVYTSGSTGEPKGVAVPQRAVVRLVRGAEWVCLGPRETLLLLAPVAFDASTFEIWGALLNGAALVVHPPEVPDPARLGAFLRAQGVTTLWMTAGLFHQVADADPASLRGVRQLLTGGDVVSPAHVRRVMDACPGLRVINGYGPTENTTFTTTHTIRAEDLDRPSLPIGRPVTGTQAYVVDARMRPLPAGVPGELVTGGEGVARGYIGRPALTAEKFVPDPFGAPGSRLYRTGDRVRWADDGTVEFLGRIDRQLKVRGFRIEPGEIEAALKAHPHVGDAVVTARADGPGGKRLVAYVVPRDGARPAPGALRDALAGQLPGHMVPSAFVVLDALPLTPNGKVDRRALPAPEVEVSDGRSRAQSPVEEVIAGLWSELLGVAAPGRDDDFFLLGGHSLIATQLVSRLRQAFGVELPLRAVFESPTLAGMAEQVDRALRGDAAGAAPPLVAGPVEGRDLPLTFAQEGLWFVDRLNPGSTVYNVPFTTRLRGALDVAALRRALHEIVRRHGSLRTRFVEAAGGPVQRVLPAEPFDLPVDDLSALPPAEREAEVRRRADASSATPYDLARGPLFRARLLRLADDEHVMLTSMHHIVCDGWSMGVFWGELSVLYEAFTAGLPSPLAPPALQYGDYAVWQRTWLTRDAVRQQLEWWRGEMAGAPPLLTLPADRPRPPVRSDRGALVHVVIPPELAERARSLARGEGATLFMALLATWSTLLSRWSGQDDVVIGSPIAGRTQRETEELIGLFVNTVPIRADLSGDPPFRALLRRVREATLGAYAHQDLPFDQLVEQLQPARSLGYTPLFQAMLAFNNTPGAEGTGVSGLRMEGVEDTGFVARTDLTLSFVPAPDGALVGSLEYANDLWDASTMERLMAQFQTLMRAAVTAPDTSVAALPVMTDAERAEVVRMGAATASLPVEITLHGGFAAQAARTPDAPAVTFGERTLSYGELSVRAERLARRLVARGAGPETLVGLCLERGMETVVGILGILRAGAAYLPLDPAYPDDRLAYMLEDSGAQLVVTTSDLADRVPVAAERFLLDADESQVDAADFALPEVSPDALAYVIYTSGSTGRPKGVQVTHANVVRLFTATDAWFRFGAGDVWTLFHSYAFDFSVWELWGALLYGGRLVVVPFDVSRDPRRFLQLLAAERVTVLNQTPSAFRQLIHADEAAGGSADLALRYVVFGGEALDPATLRGWVARRGDDRPMLVNMYGITETTVHVTYRVIREADVRAGSASPIGIPIPDLSVHLLDRRGQPVPLGVVGEMYVGGGGAARGYLNRPELTAQRFVPDPFGTEPTARLYRSGDLARRLPDGSLEFQGRADDQVKIRGFRIELGEIESVLLEHPAVREAVVLARGAADERRLVAWIVGDADAASLRTHLLAHLPEYMVPSAFVPMDALPLTRNGKVDRRALPDPDAADVAGAAYVAPRTPVEELLAGIWAELLGAERVGVADGFFELGGHSLLATRVVSRVRESFGVEMPVRAVFEHATLEAFAAELERTLGAGAGREAPPMRPVPRDGDLPLSFAQERLWFVDRLEPGSPVYHMSFPYLLKGTLDTDALVRAWTEIVRRHETLRTTFPFTGEQPVQRILPAAPVEVPLHDLSALAEEERDAEAERLIADVANRAFDLERGPLHRAALARMADDEHLLLITLHHVISDGWSIGVIWGELSALYTAFLEGRPSPLPELAIQYGDFAVWQRAWLSGEVLDAQLGYWRRKLAGAPPLLELPTDRPRPAVQTYTGAEVQLYLEGEEAEALRALARREGVTLFMLLLAAMNVVFSRLAGQDDVVIGTPIAGRTRRETEALIGLFLNSLALRTDLSGQPTFRELLRRVRETTLEAYAHQDLPFERILQELAPERSLSHSPLFQVMLNVANFAFGEVSLPGVEVHGVGADTGLASKFDLTVYAGEGPDAVALYLVYNTALFDADRAGSMLAQLAAVLRAAIHDVERPIGQVSLLTAEARSVLPDPDLPLSAEWRGSVPEIFAAHAARAPHALAVEDPAERWSYAELDASAAEIARRLMADGVRPGDVVAIHGHRGAALVRALIGTLRAGAAFLVLDPAYPAARLAEYVRIARPTGWLPIAAAGDVPAELADALRETVVSTIPLAMRGEDGVTFIPSPTQFVGEGARGTSAGEGLPEIGPDSLAYLSFTSGTTGKPKAVMGRHGSLTHFTPWLAERFELGADDRFSMLSGLAHDPLHRDVFTPLQLGAAIVAPDPEEVGTPGYLAQWMREGRVTIAHLTPAMGQLLADIPAGDAIGVIDSLRRAFFVGDVLTRTDVDRLHRLAPNLRIVNYYGSTETQRAVAHFVVPRDAAELAKDIVPVGVGIPDVQVVIRNAAGERAGVGEVGEMWMRSPHVALGYLGDPELTAARFLDGAYRTGDLGRYRPDGVAEIAGRADQQVKIRGFRIEPGEIEAALRAHPAVRDTAVVARGEGDAKRLVAYVVAEGEAPTADAMRAYLRGQVPDYMVPPAWVFLPALPVTPNGKVDRRALPEPETSAPDAHVAPRTPTEVALADVWAELLDAPVGAHDDFFALGGHSLLATRMVGRVRDALGVELPLRAIFQSPTLAGLAARVDELLRDGAADGPPPIIRRPHGGEAPASFAQERMWFVDRMEGGGPVYHIPTAQHLSGPVDVEAMRRALEELVRRHETLRTALPEVDGVPVQRIAPPGRVELPFIDLSQLSPEERSVEVDRLAERSANDPFDLEAGPLFRAALLRMSDEDHLLLVNLHHAIGDGWSLRVLLGELAALHRAYARGEPSPLPELPVQYADYAAWQREWLGGPVLDAQLGYWRQKLAGAPPLLHLPSDRPRPDVQGHRGASEALELTGEDAARVADLARREGATLFMVLLAAFNLVLARWSGEDDVVVGTPIAGRTRPELEGLIGLFLNSLALRTDLSGQPSFAEVLRRVRETTLEAYAHQDLPFERILEDLKPERSLSHTPVFQVMLNLLNYGGEADAPAGEEGGMTSLGAGAQLASKFDLTLYAAETPEGIGLHAVYDADLFDAARMRALLAQMVAVLRQAAEDANRPASALSLRTGAEAERIADSSPVVVRTREGEPAGIGELGEVWMRGPDGSLRPMGGAGRYRPDGSVELAAAPITPPPVRAAEPAPAPAAVADEPGRAPRTETERLVAAVWAEVLAVSTDEIAADTDFFALGGHSLRATQVLSRLRARTGVRLPIKTFFSAPNVAAIAAALDADAPVPSAASAPSEAAPAQVDAPTPHSRTDALTHSPAPDPTYPPGTYPLSFAQQRLWVLMQLGESAAYNLASALRLTGTLDDWALERALDEIVRRHEALRIRIEVRDGEPVQIVQPPRPVRLRVEEVRADGDTSVDDVLRATAEVEAAKPFAIEGPFLRVRLLRAADDDHVLLWTTHHLVSDGWSLGIFQSELAALYRSFVSGDPSPLRPLPVQYGQHALEQRRALSGAALDALAGWWKARLAGAPALLELPTDRPRPAEPSGEGASFWFSFPEGTADRVQALARSRGATPFMVLLAAFQALLSRWSGHEDVVVGTPIANRTRPEVEGLIGFFANTLAIRGDLSGDPPFVALLDRVRDATLGAYDHQDIPFERLVEELNPERSLSHSPVFQVMFALQNAPGGEPVAIEGLTIGGLAKGRESAKYDLTLSLVEHGGEVHGMAEYAVDLFDASTVERLVRGLVVLLDAALARPETRITGLPLLDDDDRRSLLDTSAGPVTPLPDAPLHAAFESQARRTPDATALVFGTERMSYSELDAKANQLAHLLRARGLGPDQPVAVLMERSFEMVVALYGILKAGAAYVPVDPEYPADRVAYMLADSAAALVLTQERWLGGLADVDADAVALDAPGALDAFPSHRLPDADAAGTDRLAYVIYTSGSTGRPKGAMNAHRGVVNRIAWMQDCFGLRPDDAVLQKTPFSFDVSVWEFFWPLAAGARLVIAPPGAHRDPVALNELIQREGITTLHFVPSMLRAWLDGADASACTGLRLVMSSGEALPADLVSRFFGALPTGQLHNLYGPTEAAVDVTHWPCASDVRASVPIGRPIANTRMYVLDPHGNPQPIGVPGELWIAGVQVGRGYWRRPALTAERFVPDPFASEPGARMYRTGDLARWRDSEADGENSRTDALTHSRTAFLEYLGRTDFQVKVRGFRIEPGEIEAVLAALPGVRQAVVDARPGPGGDRLVAWVAAEGAQPSANELREGVSRSLPDHMVPSVFVPVDALPLTPSGKVDRRALPEPAGAGQGGGYVPPRTAAEQLLAQAWAELLGTDRIGAGDGFFALGGHSLLATRMISRVRDLFGVELPLRAVFEAPVLRDLASRIERAGREGDDPFAPPPLVPMAPENDAPLSFAQERLWFIERLAPGASAYNLSPSLRLSGEVDAEALERALAELVRRHEPLRTAFREVDETPVQHVLSPDVFRLPVDHLSERADGDAREAEVARLATEFARTPFDLAEGPLFRARLLRVAPDDHVLLMAMHHAVSDGWSLGILFRELFALYDAFRAGEPSPLPPLPVRYADFAVWQRSWLRGEALERQLAYWRERLAGAPPLIALPTDRPRPEVQSARGGSHGFTVPADVAASVRALARREGTTLFMTLLAAWNVWLARASGDADVVVGTPIAGRTRVETEGLIGLFVNTLALRTDLSDDPDFRALLGRVRETALGAFAHQDLPFEKLVEELRPERSLSHAPLFQVMFVWQNTPEGPARAPAGLGLAPVAREGAQAKVDLTLTMAEGADGELDAGLGYAAELFDAKSAGRMAAQFVHLLRTLSRDPDAPVSAVPLLADAERAEVDRWGRVADSDLPRPLRVLDAHGQPVPAGIPGELCVAAAADTEGDTAAGVSDPFGTGATLRRTGERARWRGDGTLERLGRMDARATVRERTAPPAEEQAYVPPRTATEATVAAVWAELLGVERVGVNDGFFHLGGHSLLGTRVVSRLRDRMGVEVPLAALFAAPRLGDFAARVDDAVRAGAGVRLPAIRRTEGDTAPLSFAQERLWFLDRLDPGTPLYNMSPSLRLHGPLDAGVLADALREVVRRHEPLRTSFPVLEGEPVQRIGPVDFALPVHDLADRVEAEREEEAARRAAQWARMPFDLERGPLFRARLLRMAPEDHVLLVAMHHAVSDGWSTGIFFRELFALYDAFAQGRPSPLQPLPVRYADYAVWQRAWLAGAELDRQTAYWRETLAGAPAVLELPLDRPRPATISRRGALHAFGVPADVAGPVRALARREGATLFMALLAAFDVLLARWSGQEDVVVGTPVAGRTRRETEGLIGLFVNTLALRTDVSGGPSFVALLQRVRAATLGAYAHQDLPFEKLVEELQPERSLVHNPGFQVMFNLENAGEGPVSLPAGLALAPAAGKGAPDAKVDLTLTVHELPDGALHATLNYAAELFDPHTAERMASGLLVLLRAAADRPGRPIGDLPLLADPDRARLLADSAGPVAPVPDVPLHVLFESQARRTPDATALVFGSERMSYSGLDARANRLAHLLRARGVGPDQPVAVLMERSLEMVVALYGILKAGAAYVPVDPDYPADRVAYMLQDSAAALVLTQERWIGGLADVDADAVALDAADVLDAYPTSRVEDADAAGTDRLAYVIYTSGSTGRPKGAMNAHRGVVNRIAWMQDAFGLTAEDAVLQKTPFSFDVSVWEFFWPLAVGARLVIAPPGAHRDPAALNEIIQRERITTLHFVPSMLRAWLDGADASTCTGLRRVMSSGEALPADLVSRFFGALPSSQLHNLYGPTEAAVDVTHWPCTPDARTVVPIGRPIANTRMYVLDPRGAPQPVGVPGELWIGGIQVGRGYWHRPGLTAERFVPDPFAEELGARMYRTGDLARWRELPEAGGESFRTDALTHSRTAVLEYLGRTDFQVKVRGFRVELGEIEAALAALPGVRQAVVDARPGPGGDLLVAWVAADDGHPSPAELREGLSRTLPEPMIPSVFVAVDALPLTPSGKVDRRALADPEHAVGDGYVVPRDLTELAVARIWSEALGAPRVGATDNFFLLGGHSLLALRVMARIRARFGRDLPLAAMFQHPTVAAFADLLRSEGADADGGGLLVALNPHGTRPPLFFFPPAGGTVTHYADLARLLGPDQPFLALQAPGVNDGEEPLGTMDAMVDRYLDEIRGAQPHGPYWLGGWSAGGVMAYAAAARLRVAGEEVALLALLDPPAPDDQRKASTPDRVELLRNFAASTVTGDETLLDALMGELRTVAPDERLPALSRWIARHGGQVMDDELDRVGRVVAVFEATARAVRDYSDPPLLDVPAVLFVAEEGKPEDGAGPDARPARWRPFLRGELSVHVVPGTHAEMVLEPAVIPLADALHEVLERPRKS